MNSFPTSSPRSAAWLFLGVLLGFTGLPGCSGEDSLPNQDAWNTADALYTAVTSKRVDLLELCASRIDELAGDDRLPESAAETLRGVVAQARTGEWRPAAVALDAFLRAAQSRPRREH